MRIMIVGALVLVAAALYWALQPTDVGGSGEDAPARSVTPAKPEGADPSAAREPRTSPEAMKAALAKAPAVAPEPAEPVAAKNVHAPSPALLRARLAMQMKQGLEGSTQIPEEDRTPQGAISKESVQRGIGEAQPAVKACYEEALKGNPGLAGKLTMRFTIVAENGEGRLRDAEVVEDDVGNPFLGMCALDAVAKVVFDVPEQDGEVVVNYPFRFEHTPTEPQKGPTEHVPVEGADDPEDLPADDAPVYPDAGEEE